MPSSRVLLMRDQSPEDEEWYEYNSKEHRSPVVPFKISSLPPEMVTRVAENCCMSALLALSLTSKRVRALVMVPLFRAVSLVRHYDAESDKYLDFLFKFRLFGLNRVGGIIRSVSFKAKDPSLDKTFVYDQKGKRSWCEIPQYTRRNRLQIYLWKEDEEVDEDLTEPPPDWGLPPDQELHRHTIQTLDRKAGLIPWKTEEYTADKTTRKPSPGAMKPSRTGSVKRKRDRDEESIDRDEPTPKHARNNDEQMLLGAETQKTKYKKKEEGKDIRSGWVPLPRASFNAYLPYEVTPLPPKVNHNELTRSIMQRLGPQLQSITIHLPIYSAETLAKIPLEEENWEQVGPVIGLGWIREHEGTWNKLEHLEIIVSEVEELTQEEANGTAAALYYILRSLGDKLKSFTAPVLKAPPETISLFMCIASLPKLVHLDLKLGNELFGHFSDLFTSPPVEIQLFRSLLSLHITFVPSLTQLSLSILFQFFVALPKRLQEFGLFEFSPLNFTPFDATRVIDFPSLRLLRLCILPSKEDARSFALFKAFEGAKQLGLLELRGDLNDAPPKTTRIDKIFQGGYASSATTLVHWLHQGIWPELVQVTIGPPAYKIDPFVRPTHSEGKKDIHFNPQNIEAIQELMKLRGGRVVQGPRRTPEPKQKRKRRRYYDSD